MEDARADINFAKIAIGGGILGAIVALGCLSILLLGLPVLWYLVVPAIALGAAISLALHFMRHRTPGLPWILHK